MLSQHQLLAKKFILKLAQQEEVSVSVDPKTLLVDTFFNPHEETLFQKHILKENSNFSKTLTDDMGVIIGAEINAPAKIARFLVSTFPTNNPKLSEKLNAALTADYIFFYGNNPTERLIEKLSSKDKKGRPLAAANLQIAIKDIFVIK